MTPTRRKFLLQATTLALGTVSPLALRAAQRPDLLPRGKRRRVVIVGGGWGGLAAARHLREQAPELEVVLVERGARFVSLPLSNRWLGGQVQDGLMQHDYRHAARVFGYQFVQMGVEAVDREVRQVVCADGVIAYDWLVLAAGIRENFGAWLGEDQRATAAARARFGSAWVSGHDLAGLKRRLTNFSGGDLLMNLPSQPYRCPPAPYERAVLIASMIRARGLKARLVVLDPNAISPMFRRVFAERYRQEILYVPDARVMRVDPFAKTLATEFEDFKFAEAILMPPQQAADIYWQAGLIGKDSEGKPSGWAVVDPVYLHARDDPRIFVIGDALGPVSALFGHYPKTGHLAARLGAVAARVIAAQASERELPRILPESTCQVFTDFAPAATTHIESRFRFRGDGEIEQSNQQTVDANPRGEDEAWAKGMFRELLAYDARPV
ncbi:sulfide dehydrogenase [flavocytochrome c] flavoprotein chain [Burkholderiales bacterium]|nr:sulfide dehydrogenase [flavocytochrome c] flavoprotein chain [Burkholderiales bacterium]